MIYGAGGSVGRAVARAFAENGACVHLAGRNHSAVQALADELTGSGLSASAAALDVTDAVATGEHARSVVDVDGRIDIAFTAVTYDEVQGTPLHELPVDDVERTLSVAARSHMHTVQAVAPHMIKQRDGVVQTMVGYGPPHPLMGSTALAWQLVEAMYRQYAVELGPSGVRVQWFRTGGFRESIVDAPDYGSTYAGDTSTPELLASLDEATALGRVPSVNDAGSFAAFAASAAGRSLTAAGFNMTSGAVSDKTTRPGTARRQGKCGLVISSWRAETAARHWRRPSSAASPGRSPARPVSARAAPAKTMPPSMRSTSRTHRPVNADLPRPTAPEVTTRDRRAAGLVPLRAVLSDRPQNPCLPGP
nr:hypothetical protein GCM10010200_044280 [Actinomadura rugatobispora]